MLYTSLVFGLCASIVAAVPQASSSSATFSTLPPLPSCVQPYVFGVQREAGCTQDGQADEPSAPNCACIKAYNALESAIVADCDTADQQTANDTLNYYCRNNKCYTSNPGIFNMPDCAQNCAIPIIRENCGALNDQPCTCGILDQIMQCDRSECSEFDQQCATYILDEYCNDPLPTPSPTPSPDPVSPSPGQYTPTPTPKPRK